MKVLCTRWVGAQVAASPIWLEPVLHQREIRVRVQIAGIGAGRPERIGLDDVEPPRCPHQIRAAVAHDVLDARIGEKRAQARVAVAAGQLLQRRQLRPGARMEHRAKHEGAAQRAEQLQRRRRSQHAEQQPPCHDRAEHAPDDVRQQQRADAAADAARIGLHHALEVRKRASHEERRRPDEQHQSRRKFAGASAGASGPGNELSTSVRSASTLSRTLSGSYPAKYPRRARVSSASSTKSASRSPADRPPAACSMKNVRAGCSARDARALPTSAPSPIPPGTSSAGCRR